MWREIRGYEGLYEINRNAVIRRVKGSGSDGRKVESHVVLASNTKKGTKYISLWKGGERKTFMLHKLYAEAFGVTENEARRRVYLGFSGNVDAVDNVSGALSKVLDFYEEEDRNGTSRNDEMLYIRQFLYELKNDMAGCYVEAQYTMPEDNTPRTYASRDRKAKGKSAKEKAAKGKTADERADKSRDAVDEKRYA